MKKLVHTDSTIRESLRLNPTLIRGLLREVKPKKGIDLPDGTHLPKGAWVGIPVKGVQMDERFYAGAEEFRPFRFTGEKRDPSRGSHGKGAEAVHVDSTFLSFSYGGSAW